MIHVILDMYEMACIHVMGAMVKARRQFNKKAENKTIEDICYWPYAAEMAVAKYFNIYPNLSCDLTKKYDLIYKGVTIDVKQADNLEKDLIVRADKADGPANIYILVCGTGNEYFIKGWTRGTELFQQKYKNCAEHRNIKDCYLMPKEKLYSIDELKDYGW